MNRAESWKKEARPLKRMIVADMFAHIKVLRDGHSLRSYVCLPGLASGEAGQCFTQGVKAGVIDTHTCILGYEDESFRGMRGGTAKIRRYFWHKYPEYNVVINEGRKSKMDIVESMFEHGSVDMAFLDLCGNITPRLYDWMETALADGLSKNAVIAVTLPCAKTMPLPYRRVMDKLDSEWAALRNQFLLKFFPDMGGPSKSPCNRWGKYTQIALGLFILKCALRQYHAGLVMPIKEYHDSVIPMSVAVLNIQPLQDDVLYPDITNLMKGGQNDNSREAFTSSSQG